jgi:hypothetical protein
MVPPGFGHRGADLPYCFALVVTGLLVFTSYRAVTFEPDGYEVTAPAGLHRSMDSDNEPRL